MIFDSYIVYCFWRSVVRYSKLPYFFLQYVEMFSPILENITLTTVDIHTLFLNARSFCYYIFEQCYFDIPLSYIFLVDCVFYSFKNRSPTPLEINAVRSKLHISGRARQNCFPVRITHDPYVFRSKTYHLHWQ